MLRIGCDVADLILLHESEISSQLGLVINFSPECYMLVGMPDMGHFGLNCLGRNCKR